MFNQTHFSGTRRPSPMIYRDVSASTSLDGASPHKLVSLLYGALATQIAVARGAIARRDIVEKGRAISHAVRIVEEGLRAPLDLHAGGAIAANLNDLYAYLLQRLTMANLKHDDSALAECGRLVETLSDSWDAIADRVPTTAPVAA